MNAAGCHNALPTRFQSIIVSPRDNKNSGRDNQITMDHILRPLLKRDFDIGVQLHTVHASRVMTLTEINYTIYNKSKKKY